MTTGWVYAVHDDDGAVVYVGQTNDLPARRYRAHLGDARRGSTAPFHAWLREQMSVGAVPRVSTLERPPLVDLDARERFWICHYAALRRDGLLNVQGRNDVQCHDATSDDWKAVALEMLRDRAKRFRDGPLYAPELLAVAALPYLIPGDVAAKLAEEALASSGYLKRDGMYVRFGTIADRLSDPSVDIMTRIRECVAMFKWTGGVQPGPVSHRILAPVCEVKDALSRAGYRRDYRGRWHFDLDVAASGPSRCCSTALSDLGLVPGGAS